MKERTYKGYTLAEAKKELELWKEAKRAAATGKSYQLEILNWQQACSLLRCSKSYFYNLVNSGELPAVRSGKLRGIRVKKDDCIEYMQEWENRIH